MFRRTRFALSIGPLTTSLGRRYRPLKTHQLLLRGSHKGHPGVCIQVPQNGIGKYQRFGCVLFARFFRHFTVGQALVRTDILMADHLNSER